MTVEFPESVLTKGPVEGLYRLRDGSLVVLEQFIPRYTRAAGPPSERDSDLRTEGERDRGRLAYSSALRRLAGVTQVVSPELTAARMHSRESHTHKVALVARELAQHVIRLAERKHQGAIDAIVASGGLDIAACEAAGLAHDLGHAPFGHAGERALHREMSVVDEGADGPRLVDGFEGNPQSFRIVTRLAGGTGTRRAMDLTNVTLCAILKYPTLHPAVQALRTATKKARPAADATEGPEAQRADSKPKKFGAYSTDVDDFERARAAIMGPEWKTVGRQSLEAAIMDLADDIAYAAHDLEDFVSAEMIDVHDVAAQLQDVLDSFTDGIPVDTTSRNPFVEASKKIRGERQYDANAYFVAVSAIRNMILEVQTRSNEDSLSTVLRRVLSDRIGKFFASIEVGVPEFDDQPYVRLEKNHWHEIQVLKAIPRHWLISSPRMGMIQRAQTETVRSLVNAVIDWLRSPDVDTAALPDGLREALLNADVVLSQPIAKLDQRHYRAIADYICGMSDSEALLRANWFTGREIPGVTMVVESA